MSESKRQRRGGDAAAATAALPGKSEDDVEACSTAAALDNVFPVNAVLAKGKYHCTVRYPLAFRALAEAPGAMYRVHLRELTLRVPLAPSFLETRYAETDLDEKAFWGQQQSTRLSAAEREAEASWRDTEREEREEEIDNFGDVSSVWKRSKVEKEEKKEEEEEDLFFLNEEEEAQLREMNEREAREYSITVNVRQPRPGTVLGTLKVPARAGTSPIELVQELNRAVLGSLSPFRGVYRTPPVFFDWVSETRTHGEIVENAHEYYRQAVNDRAVGLLAAACPAFNVLPFPTEAAAFRDVRIRLWVAPYTRVRFSEAVYLALLGYRLGDHDTFEPVGSPSDARAISNDGNRYVPYVAADPPHLSQPLPESGSLTLAVSAVEGRSSDFSVAFKIPLEVAASKFALAGHMDRHLEAAQDYFNVEVGVYHSRDSDKIEFVFKTVVADDEEGTETVYPNAYVLSDSLKHLLGSPTDVIGVYSEQPSVLFNWSTMYGASQRETPWRPRNNEEEQEEEEEAFDFDDFVERARNAGIVAAHRLFFQDSRDVSSAESAGGTFHSFAEESSVTAGEEEEDGEGGVEEGEEGEKAEEGNDKETETAPETREAAIDTEIAASATANAETQEGATTTAETQEGATTTVETQETAAATATAETQETAAATATGKTPEGTTTTETTTEVTQEEAQDGGETTEKAQEGGGETTEMTVEVTQEEARARTETAAAAREEEEEEEGEERIVSGQGGLVASTPAPPPPPPSAQQPRAAAKRPRPFSQVVSDYEKFRMTLFRMRESFYRGFVHDRELAPKPLEKDPTTLAFARAMESFDELLRPLTEPAFVHHRTTYQKEIASQQSEARRSLLPFLLKWARSDATNTHRLNPHVVPGTERVGNVAAEEAGGGGGGDPAQMTDPKRIKRRKTALGKTLERRQALFNEGMRSVAGYEPDAETKLRATMQTFDREEATKFSSKYPELGSYDDIYAIKAQRNDQSLQWSSHILEMLTSHLTYRHLSKSAEIKRRFETDMNAYAERMREFNVELKEETALYLPTFDYDDWLESLRVRLHSFRLYLDKLGNQPPAAPKRPLMRPFRSTSNEAASLFPRGRRQKRSDETASRDAEASNRVAAEEESSRNATATESLRMQRAQATLVRELAGAVQESMESIVRSVVAASHLQNHVLQLNAALLRLGPIYVVSQLAPSVYIEPGQLIAKLTYSPSQGLFAQSNEEDLIFPFGIRFLQRQMLPRFYNSEPNVFPLCFYVSDYYRKTLIPLRLNTEAFLDGMLYLQMA